MRCLKHPEIAFEIPKREADQLADPAASEHHTLTSALSSLTPLLLASLPALPTFLG